MKIAGKIKDKALMLPTIGFIDVVFSSAFHLKNNISKTDCVNLSNVFLFFD